MYCSAAADLRVAAEIRAEAAVTEIHPEIGTEIRPEIGTEIRHEIFSVIFSN